MVGRDTHGPICGLTSSSLLVLHGLIPHVVQCTRPMCRTLPFLDKLGPPMGMGGRLVVLKIAPMLIGEDVRLAKLLGGMSEFNSW